jgi:phage terminase large subunit GpA-like protein
MQQTGFWFLVRAWNSRTKESWMIECGQLEDWSDVDDLIYERTWGKVDGSSHSVWRAMLDIGGTKGDGALVSRTEEAEDWWVRNRLRGRRKVFLCKGSSRSMPTKIKMGAILETLPSGKRIEHGGLRIVELDTGTLKGLFMHQLQQAAEGGSRAARLHANTPQQYFRHITSEAQDDTGAWHLVKGRDNHWLDCEMMQQAAVCAELLGGLDAVARTNQPKPPAPTPKPKPESVTRRDDPWTRGTMRDPLGGR